MTGMSGEAIEKMCPSSWRWCALVESRLLPLLPIPAQISNNRCRSPLLTASARLTAPSLRNNDSTWNLTVCWEMPSRRAAALLLSPSAIAANTSVSRGVSSGASPSSNASNDGEERPGTRTINPAAAASNAASI